MTGTRFKQWSIFLYTSSLLAGCPSTSRITCSFPEMPNLDFNGAYNCGEYSRNNAPESESTKEKVENCFKKMTENRVNAYYREIYYGIEGGTGKTTYFNDFVQKKSYWMMSELDNESDRMSQGTVCSWTHSPSDRDRLCTLSTTSCY